MENKYYITDYETGKSYPVDEKIFDDYIKPWGWARVPRVSDETVGRVQFYGTSGDLNSSEDSKNIFMAADTLKDSPHAGVSKLGTGPGSKTKPTNTFLETSLEFQKCVENPYYFCTTYLKVGGKPYTTWMSEKNFNDMIFKFGHSDILNQEK